jgi:hypothetical protein
MSIYSLLINLGYFIDEWLLLTINTLTRRIIKMSLSNKKTALAIALGLIATPSFASNTSVLPDEVLIDVFRRLDVKANANIQSVSKQFRELACDEQVKKSFHVQFCTKDWPSNEDEYYNLSENALFVLKDNAAPMLVKLKAAYTLHQISRQKGNKPKALEYAQEFKKLYESADSSIKKNPEVYDSYFIVNAYK